MDTIDKIKKQIEDNKILLYMKGTPEVPQCGFSAKVVQCLQNCKIEFSYVNILENPDIRKILPVYSDWPTFPQLYVNKKLIGGSDIISELYEKDILEDVISNEMK